MTPGKLSYFLNQVWAYIDQYGNQYPSDWELISAVTDGMSEGEVAKWIVKLTMEDANEFVQLVWSRFENMAH